MGSVLDLMTSEDVRLLEYKEKEAPGTSLTSLRKSAWEEDEVNKTTFCHVLDISEHLALAVWGQPHCKQAFFLSVEFNFKAFWYLPSSPNCLHQGWELLKEVLAQNAVIYKGSFVQHTAGASSTSHDLPKLQREAQRANHFFFFNLLMSKGSQTEVWATVTERSNWSHNRINA